MPSDWMGQKLQVILHSERGEEMTSNFFIESELRNVDHFRGCFHVCEISQITILHFPSSFIFFSNQHWTSVIMVDDKTCLYFDSFGQGVSNSKIIKFLSSYYNQIKFNKIKIQDDNSDLCGLFCICFIKYVSSVKHFLLFLNLFNQHNLVKNDYIVRYLLANKIYLR